MDSLYIQLQKEIENLDEEIESVFVGGGTPSVVEAKMYKKIFSFLKPFLKKDAEITMEANPNSAKRNWLEEIRELGVNRISIGVQSFFEDKLKLLARAHKAKEAKEAVLNAKKAGFEHINIDLIYDTLFDTKERLKEEINQAFLLPIDHISAYSLTLEENTPFEKRKDLKKEDDEAAIFFANEIKKRGFVHYEVSNFGIYKSKHNLGYWSYKNYIGVGAGAVGFYENRRFYPHFEIEKYIKNPLYKREELLTKEDIKTEKIFLGLRSEVGFDLDILNSKEIDRIKELVFEKKLFIKEGKVYNKDFFLADEIALFIES